jgi:hypothetical protein
MTRPNQGRDQFVGLVRTFAGSQPDHAFPETGGHERSQEDTSPTKTEFGRTQEDTRGYARTRCDRGSGP